MLPYLPFEIWDLIIEQASLVPRDPVWRWRHVNDCRGFGSYSRLRVIPGLSEVSVKELLKLRRVSRIFAVLARRLLIEHWTLTLSPYSNSDLSLSNLLPDARGISNLRNSLIKNVEVDFRVLGNLRNVVEPDLFLETPEDTSDPAIARCDTISELLPTLLDKTPCIKSLTMRMPLWKSQHDQDNGNTMSAPRLHMERLATINRFLTRALQLSLNYLVDLSLELPCAHDFHLLSKALPEKTLNQLKHLYLGIRDATGPDGSIEYLEWPSPGSPHTPPLPLPEPIPISNLQARYPNTQYAASVFHIVNRCPNLKSLGLNGTQFLDATPLNWAPIGSGLEHLYLYRVQIAADALIRLLLPESQQHASRLRHVFLAEVQLISGTWSAVSRDLVQMAPKLRIFVPWYLGYAAGGESDEFWVESQSPKKARCCVWSSNPADEKDLAALGRLLAKRTQGCEDYRRSLETAKGFLVDWCEPPA